MADFIKKLWITEKGFLDFNGIRRATKHDYEIANWSIETIDQALEPGDLVELDGVQYELDDDLKLLSLDC